MYSLRLAAAAALGCFVIGTVTPAHALSMAECSAKYKDAQAKGTLNGMKWNDFRKARCGADAAGTPEAKKTKTAKKPKKASEPTAANTEKAPEPPATDARAPKDVVFPRSVSKKYSSEKPGRARMHTCLDQYRTNKAKNALGGLKWVQKGGGYYAICNTRLKS